MIIKNILVPDHGSKLTGGLMYKDLRGTLVDWNLCYAADGTSSRRNFKTGTPPFMAPILLGDDSNPRRALGHDMGIILRSHNLDSIIHLLR